MDEQGRVAAVVEDHVRPGRNIRITPWPGQCLLGAPPVLLERLALPREHRHPRRILRGAVAADDNRRGRVILGREDVAGRPPNLGAERHQRLDQHRGLDRHVQRAGDPCALQRLLVGVLAPGRHQPRHLVLGQPDLLAAELGQAQIGNLEISLRSGGAHVLSPVLCSIPIIRRHPVSRTLERLRLGPRLWPRGRHRHPEKPLVFVLLEAQPVRRLDVVRPLGLVVEP